ncbi:proteasome activator [Kibdelosporangium aridum]|uniref:proteasome activator n=1 Tax=Kibdelosporangium aridum TaxID=2030 RepID=UPI00163B9AE0|nr:proteasome activator [Kibdelosporangium aridum]
MKDTVEEVVTAPAQLIRITAVVRRVVQEMHMGPMDNAARVRVQFLLRECLAELDECLDSSLNAELRRVVRIDLAGCTEKSLHVAMATLLGWLEGLVDGIQMALTAQRLATVADARNKISQEGTALSFNGLNRTTGARESVRTGQYL